MRARPTSAAAGSIQRRGASQQPTPAPAPTLARRVGPAPSVERAPALDTQRHCAPGRTEEHAHPPNKQEGGGRRRLRRRRGAATAGHSPPRPQASPHLSEGGRGYRVSNGDRHRKETGQHITTRHTRLGDAVLKRPRRNMVKEVRKDEYPGDINVGGVVLGEAGLSALSSNHCKQAIRSDQDKEPPTDMPPPRLRQRACSQILPRSPG